jgi:hypothetical protein
MMQKSQVLTRENNRISVISAGGTTMQENYLAVTERAIPVNAISQTWIFEAGKESRVGRTAPQLVNTLLKVVNWLSHLGSAKIDDGCLESRHNIHRNFRINGIGR